MKKIILVIITLIFLTSKVFAVTLSEALIQAYKNNPELNAERENIKVSEEDLNISKGDYLPTLTLSGSKSQEDTNKLTNQSGGDATITDVDPLKFDLISTSLPELFFSHSGVPQISKCMVLLKVLLTF